MKFMLYPLGGQTCIDNVDDFQQTGSDVIRDNRLVIIPNLNFTCNGRITNIQIGIILNGNRSGNSYVDVWRPSPGSQMYSLVSYTEILPLYISQTPGGGGTFLEANISLNGGSRLQFQSGDVIAFFLSNNAQYRIRYISTAGYMLYVFAATSDSSLNLTDADGVINARQPMIKITLGKCEHSVNDYWLCYWIGGGGAYIYRKN